MCVPWPNVSRPRRSTSPASSEKSGPRTSLPGPSSAGTPSTPESMRATSTPAPVRPAGTPAAARIRSSEARARAGPSSAAGSTGAVGIGHGVGDGGHRVLAAGDRLGLERGAGGGVLRGVLDHLARGLVGRHVGGDLGRRRVDGGRHGVAGLRASRPSSTGAVEESVRRTSRATLRIAAERRRRRMAPAGTRAVKPSTIARRSPDAAAEALDEPLGGVLPARLGADDDEHPRRGRVRPLGAEQREHEREREEWTDGRTDHARHIGGPARSLSESSSRPLEGPETPAKCGENGGRRGAGRLEHQSRRVCRRCESAVPRASRIGPSSKRSTSSAMKPSITRRVELAWSSPRERR